MAAWEQPLQEVVREVVRARGTALIGYPDLPCEDHREARPVIGLIPARRAPVDVATGRSVRVVQGVRKVGPIQAVGPARTDGTLPGAAPSVVASLATLAGLVGVLLLIAAAAMI